MEAILPHLTKGAIIGFDELNFDYIRFPTDGDLKSMRYPISGDRGLTSKRLIVKELMKHGILAVLTPPEKLTVNAINKYLELKARQAI